MENISTHILTKRMTSFVSGIVAGFKFQLTSSRRGWLQRGWCNTWKVAFQLTSSRRGWHGKIQESSGRYIHFNSHPHEEDDLYNRSYLSADSISTHILTKRMTDRIVYICQWFSISTHILTKRMTGATSVLTRRRGIFQLTSSRRGWRCSGKREWSWMDISTHILTKRMTLLGTEGSIMNYISTHILTKRMTLLDTDRKVSDGYFNSHPHEEDDDVPESENEAGWIFQLTSSRRGWPCWERRDP